MQFIIWNILDEVAQKLEKQYAGLQRIIRNNYIN